MNMKIIDKLALPINYNCENCVYFVVVNHIPPVRTYCELKHDTRWTRSTTIKKSKVPNRKTRIDLDKSFKLKFNMQEHEYFIVDCYDYREK